MKKIEKISKELDEIICKEVEDKYSMEEACTLYAFLYVNKDNLSEEDEIRKAKISTYLEFSGKLEEIRNILYKEELKKEK